MDNYYFDFNLIDIILIVIGILLVIGTIVFLIYLKKKRKKEKQDKLKNKEKEFIFILKDGFNGIAGVNQNNLEIKLNSMSKDTKVQIIVKYMDYEKKELLRDMEIYTFKNDNQPLEITKKIISSVRDTDKIGVEIDKKIDYQQIRLIVGNEARKDEE